MFDDIMLYLWRVSTTTFLSFLLVFGLPLLFGFIQHFISNKSSHELEEKSLVEFIKWKKEAIKAQEGKRRTL